MRVCSLCVSGGRVRLLICLLTTSQIRQLFVDCCDLHIAKWTGPIFKWTGPDLYNRSNCQVDWPISKWTGSISRPKHHPSRLGLDWAEIGWTDLHLFPHTSVSSTALATSSTPSALLEEAQLACSDLAGTVASATAQLDPVGDKVRMVGLSARLSVHEHEIASPVMRGDFRAERSSGIVMELTVNALLAEIAVQ